MPSSNSTAASVSGPKARGRAGGRPRKRSSSTELCALSSACREPRGKGINWVMCDECEEWYHVQCVGITAKQAENEDFICQLCIPNVKESSNSSSTLTNHSSCQPLPRTAADSGLHSGPVNASSSKNNTSKYFRSSACPSQIQSSHLISSGLSFTEQSSSSSTSTCSSSPQLPEQQLPSRSSVTAFAATSVASCSKSSHCNNTDPTQDSLEVISDDVRAAAESLHALASRSGTVS